MKDFVDPALDKENTPPSELTYGTDALSDWGDIMRTLYEPDCDCEMCSRY